MKKQTTRTVLIVLLILTSLFSYVYLNTVEPTVPEDTSTQYQLMESEEELQEETTTTSTKLLLPDVALIKKVIETGRSLIPGS